MKDYWKIEEDFKLIRMIDGNAKIQLSEKEYIKIKLKLMREAQSHAKQECLKVLDEFFKENSESGTKMFKTLNNELCMILDETKLKELKERLK